MNCLHDASNFLRGSFLTLVHRGRGTGCCWLAQAFCLVMAGGVMAADAQLIGLLKGQRYTQTGPTIAMLRNDEDGSDDMTMALEAFAVGEALGSLISGTLEIPGGAIVQLLREGPSNSRIYYEYQTDTLVELDTVRSNGTYTFSLSTQNDGDQQVALELTGNVYPSVPVITNYLALQTITSTNDTEVYWTPMAGGTTNDFIRFSVWDDETEETVYEVGGPGVLDGTALHVTIPASTLEPGRMYEAEVLFVKVADVNTNDYLGVIAFAGYYKQNAFDIHTRPQSGVSLNAQFNYAIPQPGAGGVPQNSAISFRFSQPMNPGFHSNTWTGVSPDNFSYEWLEENRVLLCRYSGNLPAATEVAWTLYLNGFRDAANFPLVGEVGGSFHTSSDAPESPPDVIWVNAFKTREYQQSGPTPVSTGMYGCEFSVEQSAYNRVKAASLLVQASGCSQTLESDQWDPEMGIEAMYADKNDLDSFFANGPMLFTLDTLADGLKTMTLDLGASDDYPAVPTVSNMAALQTVDPAVPLTLHWTAPDNWTNTLLEGYTFIEVAIENELGDEIGWVEGSDLTNGSHCVIAEDLLWPGRTYYVSVRFIKLKDVNTNEYAGAMGVAGFTTMTTFVLKTTGDVIMPSLQIAKAGDNINLTGTGGEPQRGYVGEASTDLIRWVPLRDLWLYTGQQSFGWYDSDAHYLKKRFYRLRDRLPDERVRQNITIQGNVWTDGLYTTPVVGAVVSTSLDGQTAVTDKDGSFFLETDTPGQDGWAYYSITVTVGATQKPFGSRYWGDQLRGQRFEMN